MTEHLPNFKQTVLEYNFFIKFDIVYAWNQPIYFLTTTKTKRFGGETLKMVED